MGKYQLTNLAVQDLSNIWNYTFDNWSERQADKYHEQFINSFKSIVLNQVKGNSYEAIETGLYGLKVNRHIVFYRRISIEQVEITRILHERMDLKNHLK